MLYCLWGQNFSYQDFRLSALSAAEVWFFCLWGAWFASFAGKPCSPEDNNLLGSERPNLYIQLCSTSIVVITEATRTCLCLSMRLLSVE